MQPADTADEVENVDPAGADHGAPIDTQTPGDQPAVRQPEGGDKPAEGSDDSDATSDPLVLAHMEPEKPAAKPATTTPPKPKQPQPAAKNSAQPPAPKPDAEPAKDQEPAPVEDEQPEREALADLPPEDWQKLTHKAKSQFLSQRKVIRANAQSLKAEAAKRKQAEAQYETVERFVRDQGLGDEDYVEAVAIGGLVKREDPRAIPLLEERLERLRAKHGQPAKPAAPPPAAPVLDDDLAALLRESEELGIDTAKVRARFKAPAAQPAAAATPPAAAVAPAQPPAAPAAQARQAPPAQGLDENVAILEALVAQGIDPAQVVGHVSGLMQANPSLRQVPPGQRLRAVLQAHRAAASRPAPPAQPTGQPLSGRGRPMAAARGTAPTTDDPLKRALMPPSRGR